ncbi:MAG: MATE family efflux transporter [Thermoplasmatales archaeon]|nr:MATE family efflux transporter [Thermoplasmatales archaeon]
MVMEKIGKIGSPSSAGFIIFPFSSLVLMGLVAGFGTPAVAAYGIGMRLNMAAMMMPMGFGFAAATLVGQNLGAKKSGRAEKSGWVCAGVGVIIMIILSIMFLLFSNNVISFFNDEAEVVNIGSQFIIFVAPTFAFLGLGMTLSRGLNGAGDTLHPMIFSFIALLFLRIPLAVYMPCFAGINGIWASFAFTNIIYGSMIAVWFRMGKWKEKKL